MPPATFIDRSAEGPRIYPSFASEIVRREGMIFLIFLMSCL
ncbi:hypothetical protein SAMN02982996_00243 [Lonsdalea quercina]|uniref:Uncharacterized protein n=1 Tax=Lonsdalea quercina TaxID=71657 RepID=A0A1H3VY28_9GAMM|nr:hypothetical protein SAMN02982996_00243 [Lonsdalea quercina]